MRPNLLILGGTTEATQLVRALHAAGVDGTISLAGRVERPLRQPLPQRIGGFGGVAGLVDYLRDARITHVIDATHPFAAQMSRNAIAACAEIDLPLVAFTRAPWSPVAGDSWTEVPDTAAAVAALDRPRETVLLAVGRQTLPDFAPNPQHRYILRLVDPPAVPPPYPDHHVIVSRGPFTETGDSALIVAHGVTLVVSKNSGGQAAYAKIAAARRHGLPVLMIARPTLPVRDEVFSVEAVFDWLAHTGTDLGV
ncbi:MAG: cobalt-precorrin-6A reductase [Pseudomonadota bacterium]